MSGSMSESLIIIIWIWLCSVVAVSADVAGTRGQNYDRIVFETASDDEVHIVAKVMTINRFADSASSVVVTDNGVTAF